MAFVPLLQGMGSACVSLRSLSVGANVRPCCSVSAKYIVEMLPRSNVRHMHCPSLDVHVAVVS